MTSGTPVSYPLTLSATQQPISRWLFLVKWLLLIPHWIVLVFIGIGVAISLLITWFSILFTGRYPRGLFDFNVGFLRWCWRVGFYGYEALGTDKYPQFSLASDAAYPADLQVEYSEKIGRLALINIILAIPHLVILFVFNGGYGKYVGGLIGLLTFVAGVINLFTGKYPDGLYKIILGMDRWSYRVAAYVMMMTNKYPPFSID